MKIDYSTLKIIGLNPTSIKCYEYLYDHGSLKVSALQRGLDQHISGVYKALGELQKHGFIATTKSSFGPTYFSAYPIEVALENFYQCVLHICHEIIRQQRLEAIRRKPIPMILDD